ncbi:MAG: hypothetical protein Q8O55_09225 [Dehalococcoidales bacterium]|nr:hypothetical protein [Dehalococcoidales bacterium]
MLRTILNRGWSAILIAVLAVLGVFYELPVVVVASGAGSILVVGLTVAAVSAREKQLELLSFKLKQLAGYFNRRFMGNSSLSVFSIIDTLFNIDSPQLWDWARACDVSQRIFNTWCSSFINRLESDVRTRRFDVYLRTYLNELWLVNSHYYEFIEQFCEIAERTGLLRETIEQYNRFAVEYNSFVQNFQETIAELRKAAGTEIEAPSVKLARELSVVKFPQTSQESQAKPAKPGQGLGYFLEKDK